MEGHDQFYGRAEPFIWKDKNTRMGLNSLDGSCNQKISYSKYAVGKGSRFVCYSGLKILLLCKKKPSRALLRMRKGYFE